MSDNNIAVLSCWPHPLTLIWIDCCLAQSQLLECSVHCQLGWMSCIFQHIQNTLANQKKAIMPFVLILPISFYIVSQPQKLETLFWSSHFTLVWKLGDEHLDRFLVSGLSDNQSNIMVARFNLWDLKWLKWEIGIYWNSFSHKCDLTNMKGKKS